MTTYPTTRAVSTAAKHDRMVVGGTDITFFRDKATPVPSYRLLEPFGYGSATIVVPQVRPYLEAGSFGTGDLAWVKKGNRVKIQRVDPATSAVTTDYRGVIIAVRASGAELTLEVGGILTGPAGLRNKQVPVYREVKDIGRWMFDGIENAGNFPGVHFSPRLGPVTGFECVEAGGMTHLGWLQQLCSLAVTKAGVQWTVMPTVPGGATFEMRPKDTTTKHCTIYLDDARAVADLVDDAAESFNTGFGTGVTKDGMIWDGTVLPGVEEGDTPPAFPGTLSIGSSGADVIALHWKLIGMGFLTRDDASPTYDQDTADAVEQLQDRANLTVTGVVNNATWDALYDVDVMGFDLSNARIMPLVQKSAVRPWNYSGTGNLLAPNPNYDPNKLRVDRNIDFGAGVTEEDGRRWMRGQMSRLSGKSWTGTITLNDCGVISGEHNPGDPQPDPADVLSGRDIQAGWNVWVANFDGGTLMHIADVQVSGGTTTLQVDTHYRDAIDLAAIRERDRESRRDLRREFIQEYRGSKKIHDSITPFNEKAGINYRVISCPANTWTGFWIFAGQAGTISELLMQTSPAAAFAVSIWGRKVSRAELNGRIGNPMPVDDDGETVWSDPAKQDFYADNLLLYSAGTEEQPCGYWPLKHTNRDRDTTPNPITGEWRDDAGFGYATGDYPALWVAVYPLTATTITRGRLLKAQLETGV